MSPWKLSLEETREGCAPLENRPRYWVKLNGARVGDLYFNMTGYTGCLLPTPQGGSLYVGESPISTYRRIAVSLNKEAKAA